MGFVNTSGEAGTLLFVVGTVICHPGPLSGLKDIIPWCLQVLLTVSPFWNLLLSEESQFT